jgi:NAD(P)-dependent dehydrogenase (short-subunit alcohol dehydrogenase family)
MNHQSITELVRLTGRRALVTGAGSGIGRTASVSLAQAGASVLALDLSEHGLAGTRSAAQTADAGSIETVAVDVSDAAAVEAALAAESFHIVVNAAGIMAPETLATTSRTDWDQVLAVNLTGYFNVLKSTVPRMSRPGSVIQVASIQGHTGVAFPSYTATKGAILALSRQLGAELGPDGIRVNSVSPGMILTGMTQDSLTEAGAQEAVASRTPLRRVGNAADIANAILYLASDLSSFVTATDILVDGGLISSLQF